MRIYILISFICLTGCSTIATQSDDGKTLKLRGIGKAKFENGAEIEGKPIIEMPRIKLED